MAKPEWGVKRACLACGTRFYDMQKDPIVCPSCGVKFDPEAVFRPRRPRAPAEEPVAPVSAPAASEEENLDEELAAFVDEADELGEDEDDAAIEDTSDLDDDDGDVPVVTKNVDDQESD